MKLNLGAGAKPLSGYTNVDLRPLPGIDLVADLRQPLPVDPGTVEEIYAKHIIEHFTPAEWVAVLADWLRVLAPGGRLVIECPDLRRCCEKFIYSPDDEKPWWHLTIYGDPEEGGHHQGFTIPRLRRELEAAGLRVVRAVHWHDDVDERQNYNMRVEAVKP